MDDTAHIEAAVQHNETWLPWLTAEIEKLGLEVTPSVANFVLIHFPTEPKRDAAACDAFLKQRGIILRRVGGYGLPGALRLTVGTRGREPQGRGRARRFRRRPRMSAPQSKVMFERIALIGIGLIGSSISHAARRGHLAKSIVGSARTPATVETALRLGLIDKGYATAAEAAEGADLVILCVPVGLCGPIAKEIAPVLKPGAILTDVGSVKAAIVRDVAPHVPEGRAFHSRPPDRRHRAVGS